MASENPCCSIDIISSFLCGKDVGITTSDGKDFSHLSHSFFKSSGRSLSHGSFLSQMSRNINLAVSNKGDTIPMGSYILAMLRSTIRFAAVGSLSGNVIDRLSFSLSHPTPRSFISDVFVPKLSLQKLNRHCFEILLQALSYLSATYAV